MRQYFKRNLKNYDQLYSQAKQQERKGNYSIALQRLDEVIKIRPKEPSIWYEKANLLAYNLEDHSAALDAFDKSLSLVKEDKFLKKKILNGRGHALRSVRNYEQAIDSYNQALELDQSYWQARRGLALALFNSAYEYKQVLQLLSKGILLSEAQLKSEKPNVCRYHRSGCGELHRTKGRIQYLYGLRQEQPLTYFEQALSEYYSALEFFRPADDFPEEHLEVLEELVKILLFLGRIDEAEHIEKEGSDFLNRLIATSSDVSKIKKYTLRFSGFNQLTVDILARRNAILDAWLAAEKGKNICLKWLLWNEDLGSPNYLEIKSLIPKNAAVIYWHLSPAALTTFILKSDASHPVLVNPDSQSNSDKIPDSLSRLLEFESWLRYWDERYSNYREKGKSLNVEKKDDPWRISLESVLKDLSKILYIEEIEAELNNIQEIILVPHRDLHRVPLHTLFSKNFDFVYLPSLQVGSYLQKIKTKKLTNQSPLLNVDDPSIDGVIQMPFAQLESEIIRTMFLRTEHVSAEQATKSTIFKELNKDAYSVFHFTGHGEYVSTQPEMSRLGLVGSEELTAKEIINLKLDHLKLVTIAACETALTGNSTITTEYVGLVSAFLKANTKCVLSTLWTVEEISSAWLIIRFYQLILKGYTPVSALNESQRWLKTVTGQQLSTWLEDLAQLENLSPLVRQELEMQADALIDSSSIMELERPIYSHPYYWAAFTLTGRGIYETT
jgi:CHAT domain-containing protein